MRINPVIFRQYDIRGIYPGEINERVVYQIGGNFVGFLLRLAGVGVPRKAMIVVGRDLRKSSKPLAENFIKGAVDAGADVMDIGVVTSPILYFAKRALKADGGAMITASHNPLKYNGIKMLGKNGDIISGEEIKETASKNFQKIKEKGECKKTDILKEYFEEITKDFHVASKTKISVDSGGGAAKLFLPEFLKRLGMKESKKPDIYFSFDYDADRLIILDKNKKEIGGDIIGAIISDTTVKKDGSVVYDLRCSRTVPEYFRNRGITAIPGRVGRYDIIKTMKQRNASFGMELTGHYYFKKMGFSSDAFFAARKILESAGRANQKISDMVKNLAKHGHSGIINLKVKDFDAAVKKLKAEYGNAAFSFTDGLTAEFSNWWFNIRQSNTEPLVRLVIETKNQELLDRKKKELLKILAEK